MTFWCNSLPFLSMNEHCASFSERFVFGIYFFFFFQAEDGIRDDLVTGVQTCALPILIGVFLLENRRCFCRAKANLCDWDRNNDGFRAERRRSLHPRRRCADGISRPNLHPRPGVESALYRRLRQGQTHCETRTPHLRATTLPRTGTLFWSFTACDLR